VVVAAFLIFGGISYGTRFSFGVFFKSLEDEFNLTRVATSGIFSTYALLCPIFALLCGWALDRYGPKIIVFPMGIFTGLSLLLTSQVNNPWQLYITYSLLLAMGTGAAYSMLMATTARWFDKKRGLAMGIASSGNGLGTAVIAPLASYLILTFNWRTALIILGVIASFAVTSSSLLLKKNPAEIGLIPDGAKEDHDAEKTGNREHVQLTGLSLHEAIRTPNFWFFAGSFLLWGVCSHLILTHIIPHTTDMGISSIRAAGILSLITGMTIPGRLVMGAVSDHIGKKRTAITCALIEIVALTWLVWARDLWTFYLFAVVFGLCYGGLSPPLFSLLGDIFGLRSLGIIMGALDFGWGIGSAIGPLLGGLAFDITNSYSSAFITAAISLLLIALFIGLVKRPRRLYY